MSLLASCGSDSAGPDSIVGVYTLRTIDGQTMPVTLSTSTGELILSAGSLTLNADATFSRGGTVVGSDGDVSEFARGVYVRSGAALALTIDNGSVSAGIIDGNTIRVTNPPPGSDVYIYSR